MTGGLASDAGVAAFRCALTWAIVVALPSHGLAQARVDAPIAAPTIQARGATTGPIVTAARAEIERLIAAPAPPPAGLTAAAQSSPGPRAQRSWPRRLIGGLVGGAGGFFLGGYLGASIEGDSCDCDDPGLKGALIGAPIGAVVGGVLGALFLF
jgi:hypothetical protein